MNKSYARAGMILALLAAAPVVALDFHGWRTDGIYIQGSSVNQQSSNQANNIHDDLLDAKSVEKLVPLRQQTGERPNIANHVELRMNASFRTVRRPFAQIARSR